MIKISKSNIYFNLQKNQNDPNLANGYNGIGMSQGGLLIRGLAQRCPDPPMKNLVTYGAPSNGQFGIPDCEVFKIFAYDSKEFIQK